MVQSRSLQITGQGFPFAGRSAAGGISDSDLGHGSKMQGDAVTEMHHLADSYRYKGQTKCRMIMTAMSIMVVV
jgi:hypothetical protein